MPKGDHITHFWGWIKRPITRSSVWKCSYANDTIEKGPMMWVSSTMDGNKQEGTWLTIKCKALKWVKGNKSPLKDHLDVSQWQMGWLWHHLHDYNDYKIEEIQMHRMHI
jgi:hypothetical protein